MERRALCIILVSQLTGLRCAEPGVPACEETTTKLDSVDDRGPLRSSLQEAVGALDGPTTEVQWIGPETTAGKSATLTTSIELKDEAPTSIVAKRNDFESEWVLDCGTRSEGQSEVRLSTADGAIDVLFEGQIVIADEHKTLFIAAEAKGSANSGTLEFDSQPEKLSFTLWAENGTVRHAEVIAFGAESEDEDGMKADQSFVRVFEWGTDVE